MKNVYRFTVNGEHFDLPEPVGMTILEESGVRVDKQRFCFGTDINASVYKIRRILRDLSRTVEEAGTKVYFSVVRHEANVLGHYITIDKSEKPWVVKSHDGKVYGTMEEDGMALKFSSGTGNEFVCDSEIRGLEWLVSGGLFRG